MVLFMTTLSVHTSARFRYRISTLSTSLNILLLMLVGAMLAPMSFPIESGVITNGVEVTARSGGGINPLWRVDLRTIVPDRPLGEVGNYARVGSQRYVERETRIPVSALVFTDDGTLVATFITRENGGGLSMRNSPSQGFPMRLHAIFLDATLGTVLQTAHWPTDSRWSRLIAAHDGMFVTQRGDLLTLYDSKLNSIKSIRLPAFSSGENWKAISSVSGRNILFIPHAMEGDSWLWVRMDDLKLLRHWQDKRDGWVSVSDDRIAMVKCGWQFDCNPEVETRSLDSGWTHVASATHRAVPRFLSSDTIAVLDAPTGSISIFSGNGKQIDTLTGLKQLCWWETMVPSSNGRYLAVPNCKTKGKMTAFDISGKVLLEAVSVFTIPPEGPSSLLKLGGPKIEGFTQMAISPDGFKLAILNNEYVEVFDLHSSMVATARH